MNFRDILHRIQLLAAFIATLTLPVGVFGSAGPFIVSVAGFIALIISGYLTATTTGLSKSELPTV